MLDLVILHYAGYLLPSVLLVSVLGCGVNELLIPVLAWTEVYASDSIEVILMGFSLLGERLCSDHTK